MSWSGSSRRFELPPDWPVIRKGVLKDARYMCEKPGCFNRATDVDHKRRGNDHSRKNLQALCSDHHGKKSSREGVARRAELRARRKRPTERHPGIT